MKLCQLIDQYVGYRKSLGEKFKTNETILKTFCRAMGPEICIRTITAETLHRYLYNGSEKVSAGWFGKHTALLGLYRYATGRGHATEIPLPQTLPKRPQGLVPYIYSKRELKLLFDGALTYQKNKSHIEPYMVRMSLILTYTLGLRVHETLSITLGDIDMDNLTITIQRSKFYKSRLVPFNEQVAKAVLGFLQWRKNHNQPQSQESHLFMGRYNEPFNGDTLRGIFQRIRDNAKIKREEGASYPPRLHDLRHTFAVNRLVGWYRKDKNVQKLLPMLSVYMGHSKLAHTSIYLSMTDNLLREANYRFEEYVKKDKT